MNILPFLSQALPLGLAVKGISATSKKLQAFLGGAAAADYGVDQALDFLRDVYGGEEEPLKLAGKNSRPEERAVLSRASASIPAKIAKGAAKVGGAYLGGKYASKFMDGDSLSKSIKPEVLSPQKLGPKQLGYKDRKEIGFSPRTKVPDHKFPKPKTPPPSNIPAGLEDEVRFHMEKSGVSEDEAISIAKILKTKRGKASYSDNKRGLNSPKNTSVSKETSSTKLTGEEAVLKTIEDLIKLL